MESLYFGSANWQGNQGAGSGPWVGADLECGMYYGGGNATKINKRNQPSSYTVSVEGDVPKELQIAGNETAIQLPAQGEDLKSLVFSLPQSFYTKPLKMVVRVTETATGNSVTTMPIEFVGPDPKSKNHDYLDASKYLQK